MTTNDDSDQTITPPHSRPLQKWILFGLVFVGVPLSLYFGYLIMGKIELQKVQQEYKETGYPFTLQDLDDWYPTPTGENAAEYYMLAGKQIVDRGDWEPDKKLLAPIKREVYGGIEPGSQADDRRQINRVVPYIGDGKMPELGKRVDPVVLALLSSYMQVNQTALETIDKAIAIKESRYPIDNTKEYFGSDYLGLPYSAARLLSIQTVIDTHADRSDKVGHALLGLHAIARSIEREPRIKSCVATISIHAKALTETERALNLLSLSDNDLVQLSNAIDTFLKSDGLFRAAVGECVVGIAMFEGQLELAFEIKSLLKHQSYLNLPLLKMTGLYDRDHTTYLTLMLANIQATQLPIDKRYNELEKLKRASRALPRTRYFSRGLLNGFNIVAHRNDCMFVQAIVQKVGLAVERYRLKHGKLPEKLDDLTPEFLEKLPDDSYTSKPLHYKKLDGGGFMVYSVGEDATDDGGQRKNSDGREYVPGTDICFEIRR